MSTLPKRVTICEVGPRDGLQIEKKILSTTEKIKLIEAICRSGVPKIEVTSFVNPKAMPQMADSEALLASLPRNMDTKFAALVPNLRGLERALKCQIDEIKLVVSASETHNRANVRMTVEESIENVAQIMEQVKGTGLKVVGGMGTAFGCPFEGIMPEEQVLKIIERYDELGISNVHLADTTGMANPRQVESLVTKIKTKWPELHLILHFHNTRGAGLANVLAGLQSGVEEFEGSLGGIGGCPFAPGATGNVCTEDMVHMLHEMKIETGIDLDKLIQAAKAAEELLEHPLPGQVMKAGKNSDLHTLKH